LKDMVLSSKLKDQACGNARRQLGQIGSLSDTREINVAGQQSR
jgi:hypothetical protein